MPFSCSYQKQWIALSNPTQGYVLQGSVIAPALFNLYAYDIPATFSRKHIYADDIAMIASDKSFRVVEQTMSDDLDKLTNYFYNCAAKSKYN